MKLSDKWRLSNELTARFSSNRSELCDLEDDFLLGYQLNRKFGIWAGYVHDPQYSGADLSGIEHRFREQVTFAKVAQVVGGSIDARLRFERRWRDGIEGVGWRFRPFVEYSHPFKAGRKTALVISHEGFWNLNMTSIQDKSGFERMRHLTGLSAPITNNVVYGFPQRLGHDGPYRIHQLGLVILRTKSRSRV